MQTGCMVMSARQRLHCQQGCSSYDALDTYWTRDSRCSTQLAISASCVSTRCPLKCRSESHGAALPHAPTTVIKAQAWVHLNLTLSSKLLVS